ncbi:3-oxoacyl-ACP synthase III family protein [Paenibacillus sp. Soil787]|uniref:3-oxoacyl-ACP synthase III family protein n=1 Tax=Paenibacillus sp. Soil787 TaxID=1736411 RepID=UPI0006FEBE93|nr:beta-ketoacyl-ACP synthase III [Paenibacillus sp. Soil787]KRF41916.1 3-oxoacyl-ACP synthase [Paenibacillus sp. Soil787]
MYDATIHGVGSSIPIKRLTNADLEKMVGVSDEWVISRTGIKERRVADHSEATSDFAYKAAIGALEDASLNPSDIDMILVATETPDHILPPVASQIQHRLRCSSIGVMDIHATCIGFLSSLQIAEMYIKAGKHKNILVIGADTLSKLTDYTDPYTSILFGDGAGAVIVSRSEETRGTGILSTLLHADGGAFEALFVPGGGSRHPASDEHKAKMVMDGSKVFKLAVKSMTSGAEEILQNNGLRPEDVDWVIPHQANERIIDAVARNLGMPEHKIIKTIQYYGNSCSATIPISLHQATMDGRIKRGDLILMVAFGAGFVWGSALIRY